MGERRCEQGHAQRHGGRFAKELAPRGIKVNAISPGWVRTAMGGPGAREPKLFATQEVPGALRATRRSCGPLYRFERTFDRKVRTRGPLLAAKSAQ